MISPEVGPVVGQVVQCRQRGDLAQAVDVVAVADLVERGDEVRVADAIADALEAKRIGLREGPRDQHMRVFQREARAFSRAKST